MKEDDILKAAKELFTKHGFKRVSMDEIALVAGTTKKTVYSYFSSKEELLNRLIEQELKKMRKKIEKCKQNNNDVFQGIHNGIVELLKYRRKNNLFRILFEEADFLRNKKLKESLKVIEQDILGYIRNELLEAEKSNGIVVKNIDVMSFLIYKMYLALIIEWNEGSKEIDEKELADNILYILKNGIKRKEVECDE